MWQNIAVYIIFAVCAILIVRHFGKFFTGRGKDDNPCSTCSSDCKLRELKNRKDKCKTIKK